MAQPLFASSSKAGGGRRDWVDAGVSGGGGGILLLELWNPRKSVFN